jgi:REP element-mobilizing transposase RayT
MARIQRCVLPGEVSNRGRVFFAEAERTAYLRLMANNLADAGMRLLSWCLISSRVHFVAGAEQDDSLSVVFRRGHGHYAQMTNARRSGRATRRRPLVRRRRLRGPV